MNKKKQTKNIYIPIHDNKKNGKNNLKKEKPKRKPKTIQFLL